MNSVTESLDELIRLRCLQLELHPWHVSYSLDKEGEIKWHASYEGMPPEARKRGAKSYVSSHCPEELAVKVGEQQKIIDGVLASKEGRL